MFLTVHASAGLLIGSQTTNPWLAFVLGWLSHWLLDFIPHGDEELGHKHADETKQTWHLFWITALDCLCVVILFYGLTNSGWLVVSDSAITGMIGAIAPDFLWGLQRILKIRLVPYLQKIHSGFHQLLKIFVPLPVGFVIQLIALSTFIYLTKL